MRHAYAQAMATSVRSLALIVLLTAFGPAGLLHAEIAPPPPQTPEQNKPPRAAMLDQLFSELANSPSAEEGKKYEAAIEQLWLQSGSPSIDILMQRGIDAYNEKKYDRAFYYFNEVVVLDPAYSEGWHKRATVYYVQDNFSRALADIEHVLRIEPRQFLAMGGLALMLEELGDKKGALEVFRRALAVNPWLEGAAQSEKSLAIDVEGRGI